MKYSELKKTVEDMDLQEVFDDFEAAEWAAAEEEKETQRLERALRYDRAERD